VNHKAKDAWLKLVRAGVMGKLAVLTAWGATLTFSNTNFVTISDSMNPLTPAAPYPSAIVVTGLAGLKVTKVTATLHGFSHSFPSDVSAILVGPQGQSAILLSETGGQMKLSVTNLTLTLDDDATNSLPIYTNLVSGVFKPTNGYLALGDTNLYYDFPSPAPPGNSNSPPSLAVFQNTNPQGTWNLFMVCDAAGYDYGSLSNGWSLAVTVATPLQINRSGTNILVYWLAAATNCHLQSVSNLSGSAGWTDIPAVPALYSNNYYLCVTNPISAGNAFFRLTGGP
jgi:hypothetical protein